jgi:hypothetical protein
MPGRIPIGWDEENEPFVPVRTLKTGRKEVDCTAVAAFLPPDMFGLLGIRKRCTRTSFWAYSSVGWKESSGPRVFSSIDPTGIEILQERPCSANKVDAY